MAIEPLPGWASDLSWIEDAYRTDEGQTRIEQIAQAVFTDINRNPMLVNKAYEIIQWGVEHGQEHGKKLLLYWRTFGFGTTYRRSFGATITRSAGTKCEECNISCEIISDPSLEGRSAALEAIFEILRIDRIIQKLALFSLYKLDKLGDFLATMSNLKKLDVEISQLPPSDICKLFSVVQRSQSIEEFTLSRYNPNYHSKIKEGDLSSTDEIKTAVSLMLKENKSIKLLKFIHLPFSEIKPMQALVDGLSSISENNSIQKLSILNWNAHTFNFTRSRFSGLRNHGLKLDDFFTNLAMNRSLQELELDTDLQISDIISLLGKFKIYFTHNLHTLIIQPRLFNEETYLIENELDPLFSTLTENRTIQKLTYLRDRMPPVFDVIKQEYFFLLASNNQVFQSFEIRDLSQSDEIESRTLSKLEENKNNNPHPSLKHILFGCV